MAISRTAVVLIFTAAFASADALQPQIVTSFGGLNFNQGAGWVPSDMAFAVGPNQVMQVVNGGFQVFNRAGVSLTGAQTDISFWNAAGIPTSLTNAATIFDPRLLYDSASGRFFAIEDVSNIAGDPDNQVLLGVSKTSNPRSE